MMVFTGFTKDLNKVEKLRQKFVIDFPRESLKDMTLEQYAIGHGDHDNFCYRLEFEQEGMGRISGLAGSQKFGVWCDKKSKEYKHTKKYGDSVEAAFSAVKNNIVELLDAGEKDDTYSIHNNPISQMVKYKLLAMYYPNKYLTIYSHLPYFCEKVGIPSYSDDNDLIKQRKLLQWKESNEETRDFTLLEFANYLYVVFGRPNAQNDMLDESEESYKNMLNRLKDYDGKHPKKAQASVEITKRSKLVADTAKARAKGHCQLCKKPAPFFYGDGKPCLESHHIIPISEQGIDELENVVALCPNCHRKMHLLHLDVDVKKLMKIAKNI